MEMKYIQVHFAVDFIKNLWLQVADTSDEDIFQNLKKSLSTIPEELKKSLNYECLAEFESISEVSDEFAGTAVSDEFAGVRMTWVRSSCV